MPQCKLMMRLLCSSNQIVGYEREIISVCSTGLAHIGRLCDFLEQLCCAITLGPKLSNKKFVYLLQLSTILVLYILVLTVNHKVQLYWQVPLDNALVLGNLHKYLCERYVARKTRFLELCFCCRQYKSIYKHS